MSNDEVLSQLRRILHSRQLVNSVVLTDFLNFVVHETLAGRGENLKEYTIGIEALKKNADFNPQLDSIVRIHAGRLRRALKEYYYEQGKDDAILISIPKGNYAPVFEYLKRNHLFISPNADLHPEEQSSDSVTAHHTGRAPVAMLKKPTIAILPFKKIGSTSGTISFASGLCEYLSTELTHFQTIKVLTDTVSDNANEKSTPSGEIVQEVPDFILTGSVQWLNEKIRILIQFKVNETKEQLWAQTFERTISLQNYLDLQEEIVSIVLASITGLNGAITRYLIERTDRLPDEHKVYPLKYWYYHHSNSLNLEKAFEARVSYMEILKHDPYNALAYAYLSRICCDQFFLEPEKNEQALEDGFAFAHKSIKCDNRCQEAYLALAISLLFRNNVMGAIDALEQGALLNPHNAEYHGGMGALLIFMGHNERGNKILERAFALTRYLPWWNILAFSFHAFHKECYQDAIFWADRIEKHSDHNAILKAASYAHLGEFDKAIESLNDLEMNISFRDILDSNWLNHLFTQREFAQKIHDGLSKLKQYKSIRA